MFTKIAPILKQCEHLTLSMTPHENGEVTVVLQSTLKRLDENASDNAKQLYAALAMPLVVTASVTELEASYADLLAEYCQQHTQSQTALEQSLERVKESNKAARQTASASAKTASKTASKSEPQESKAEPAAPAKTESITAQTNPVSLF